MYKRQKLSACGLFSEATAQRENQQSKEEALIIRAIKKRERLKAREKLTEVYNREPTDEEVEGFLNFIVEEARETGLISEYLKSYLKKKIEDEQVKYGCAELCNLKT